MMSSIFQEHCIFMAIFKTSHVMQLHHVITQLPVQVTHTFATLPKKHEKTKTLNPLMLLPCFEILFSLPQTQLMVVNIYLNTCSLQGWHYGSIMAFLSYY